MQICPFHRLRRSVILQFIAESFVLEGASLHFLGWRRTRKVFFRFEVCLWFKGQLAAKFNAGNYIYKLLKFPTTFTCMPNENAFFNRLRGAKVKTLLDEGKLTELAVHSMDGICRNLNDFVFVVDHFRLEAPPHRVG